MTGEIYIKKINLKFIPRLEYFVSHRECDPGTVEKDMLSL